MDSTTVITKISRVCSVERDIDEMQPHVEQSRLAISSRNTSHPLGGSRFLFREYHATSIDCQQSKRRV